MPEERSLHQLASDEDNSDVDREAAPSVTRRSAPVDKGHERRGPRGFFAGLQGCTPES